VDGDVGSISPGRLADILIVDDLEKFIVREVIADGVSVAKKGRLTAEISAPRYPKFVRGTMKLNRVRPQDFEVRTPADVGRVKVRVIGLVDGQVLTEHRIAVLKVKEGVIGQDLANDIVKAAVVERHRATGNIGLGFVQGFGIKEGAIASSVGHDAHNITVVGADNRDMAAAVNAVARSGGGQVAVRGEKILAKVELPIAGLMSDRPVVVVSSQLEALHSAAKELGIKLRAPFMCMSFLPLAVIPRLRITDKGLVDVENFKLVDLVVG